MGWYQRANFSRAYPVARGVAPLLVSLGGLVLASERIGPQGSRGDHVHRSGCHQRRVRSQLDEARSRGRVLGSRDRRGDRRLYRGRRTRCATKPRRSALRRRTLRPPGDTVGHHGRRSSGLELGRAALHHHERRRRGADVTRGVHDRSLRADEGSLGVVSALRETGVVWAALFGVVIFKEGRARAIMAPAMAVTLGVALLSLH